MIQRVVAPVDGDEHVFVHVAYPDGVEDVSIDIDNQHGRRAIHVRVGGMGVGSILLDREITPGHGDRGLRRFCPYCGEQIVLTSSRSHRCSSGED